MPVLLVILRLKLQAALLVGWPLVKREKVVVIAEVQEEMASLVETVQL